MNIDVDHLRKQLHAFDFRRMFINELGWDRATNQDTTIQVDGQGYCLRAVAQKRGLVVFHCPTPAGLTLPDYATRRKIDARVRKTFHEHLIIFTDPANTRQKWLWVRREPGKPSAGREIGFGPGQSGEALIQRLQTLAFSLEEEEGLTIVDVNSRVRAGFDLERVTRRFYDRFKTERTAFLKFLQGIPDEDLQRWYVSVTLNRLMFVYFIQWKGFLDGDQHYLRNRLQRTRQQLGEDHFYRDFLCPLFFEGFAQKERSPQIRALLGNVPYLNGGIFQRHSLEERFGQAIHIPDAAFTRLFDFFDGYNWHLDERPLRDDREINPDVLGFIFEKYINQKQMGAYYTKEDITGYISKYTILPALFERARKDCRIAFEGESAVWKYLAAEPERYLYPAVLKGIKLPLPENIAAGIQDVAQRGDWNRPADEAYALPTEIWRETVARRQRAEEVRLRLAAGEIRDINDLITYNLDIQQFAQDVIEGSEGPELVRAFWKALVDIKVLDPTCGSGAFLFAALNILEPLYEACLERMQSFVEELDAAPQHHPEKYSDFRRILGQVARHPNRSYFIFKSIIVQNLYGVDIMAEAVEICKLRLFLKLIAQVEQVQAIEPLPDIDFNVRAGNTLIGFTTREEVRQALTSVGQQGTLGLFGESKAIDRVEEQAELADKAFQRFRQMQTDEEMEAAAFAGAKEELRKRLNDLNNELNRALALRYLDAPIKEDAYRKWLASYQPFHWFVDFYGIMYSGGFDVIIGNPPYLNLSEFNSYDLEGFVTVSTKNLYPLILERCDHLCKPNGQQGFIVPISSIATEGYLPLQTLLAKRHLSFSCYDDRPAHLFNDLDKNTLSILLIGAQSSVKDIYSTRLCRWNAEARGVIFDVLSYHITPSNKLIGCLPKIGSEIEASIWHKLWRKSKPLSLFYQKNGLGIVFYSRKINSFLQILDFIPVVLDGQGNRRPPSEFKELRFRSNVASSAVFCCLSSSLFRWFIDVTTDGSHLNKREIDNFPFDPHYLETHHPATILSLASRLSKNLIATSENRVMKYSHDTLTVQCIIAKHSKPILDEVDALLAQIYSLTEEELDFIQNYDIKFRMGKDIENKNDEE